MQNDDRRAERSRAALITRFPDLSSALDAPPTTKPIVVDGVTVDLIVDGRRFLGDDGRTLAATQVAAFLETPIRFLEDFPVRRPGPATLERRVFGGLLEDCRRLGLDESSFLAPPPLDSGFLIVLGIGLGHHLPALLERTRARHLIVAESEAELLRQSTGAIDWRALCQTLESRGGGLDLILSRSAEAMAEAVARAIEARGAPFLDGSLIYQHYENPILEEAGRLVVETADRITAIRDSYESEIALFGCAAANLVDTPFRPVDGHERAPRPEPVIIVGSGPSLDAGIEHVKRLREGAVVISCGTALRVCRDHGIVPDYHCETGTAPWTLDLLQEIGRRHGVGNATLIAPVTLDPRVPRLFERTLFHFGDGSVVARTLAEPDPPLGGAGPGAANLALAAAAALGFRTAYLFGVDCGSRLPDRTHARGSAYEAFDVLAKIDRARALNLIVPGTFGGEVATEASLDAARHALGRRISVGGLKVYNCSNGAMIDGTRPRHGTDVSFAIPRLDHARVRREVEATLRAHDPGAFLTGRDFTRTRAEAARRFETLIAVVAGAEAKDADLHETWAALKPLLDHPEAGVAAIAAAPIQAITRRAAFLLNRIPDAGRRRAVLAAVHRALGAALAEMRTDAETLLAALAL